MSNLIYKGIVEDIRNDKCSDGEIEKLLEIFTKAIGYFTSDINEKSWDNLENFSISNQCEVTNFSLKISRKKKNGIFHYIGAFKSDSKNLKIFAKSNN
ncbi:hypothetical protein N9O56_01185 [Rickettsiales bacterium]|nr:hypothetical protein [Rickettsiales bacterium]